jgi:hypothetical protein
MLSTPQAPHESRIFHIGTPAKVSLRETHTHRERDPHTELEETREIKFSQLLYYKKDTKKNTKQLILILFFNFFVAKIRQKVPHENIHGEASVLQNFQKKKLNYDISKREKKKEF